MNFKLKEIFGEEWYLLLEELLLSTYFKELGTYVKSRRNAFNVEVYPSKENVFRAFRVTPLSQLKVVILGQD